MKSPRNAELIGGVTSFLKDIEAFETPIGKVKYLQEMLYLPVGAIEYCSDYGIKKYYPAEVVAADIGCEDD